MPVVGSSNTRDGVVAALLAALLAASAWISLPISPVPVTLQVFVVALAAMLLRPRWAATAVGLYVLLGAAGVPVFAGPSGGIGVIVGPTGGYILGFLAGAALGSLARAILAGRMPSAARDAVAGAVAILVTYLLGWTQLAVVMRLSPVAAFAAGVAPFAAIDAIKVAVAVMTASILRRAEVVPATAS